MRPTKPSQKKAVVRNGQRKPFRKCTKEQFEERVEVVAGMYAENPLIRRGEIAKIVKKKFNIEFRQCAEYIACAHKLNRKRSEMPKDEAKSIVVNSLLAVIGTGKNVVQATNTLCDIYGLFAPHKTEISGPAGGKIELEHKVGKPIDYARLEGLASSLFGISAPDGNGESLHPADPGTEAGSLPKSDRH